MHQRRKIVDLIILVPIISAYTRGYGETRRRGDDKIICNLLSAASDANIFTPICPRARNHVSALLIPIALLLSSFFAHRTSSSWSTEFLMDSFSMEKRKRWGRCGGCVTLNWFLCLWYQHNQTHSFSLLSTHLAPPATRHHCRTHPTSSNNLHATSDKRDI